MSFEPQKKARSGDFEVWHVGPNHYTVRDRKGIQPELDICGARLTQFNQAFRAAQSLAKHRKMEIIQ